MDTEAISQEGGLEKSEATEKETPIDPTRKEITSGKVKDNSDPRIKKPAPTCQDLKRT